MSPRGAISALPSASAAASAVFSALHVGLPVLRALAPGRRALDRRAELVARGVERLQLVLGAEDGHGHRPVGVLAQVVVVEVDAVVVGLELQLDRRGLVGQVTSTRLRPWFGSIPRSASCAHALPAVASATTVAASNAMRAPLLVMTALPLLQRRFGRRGNHGRPARSSLGRPSQSSSTPSSRIRA